MTLMRYALAFLFILFGVKANADVCSSWFVKSKIKKESPDCLIECSIYKIDMGTFGCHNACPELCGKSQAADFVFQISSLYPSLNDAERALIAEHPLDATKVFKTKIRAESVCENAYGRQRSDDESDACRHFIWGGLTDESLGTRRASEFLNAHEQEPTQKENAKAMDLANKRAGILAAEDLMKNKSFSEEKLFERFNKALQNGELIVIKPRK